MNIILCLIWGFLVFGVGVEEQESLYKIFLASLLGGVAISLLIP